MMAFGYLLVDPGGTAISGPVTGLSGLAPRFGDDEATCPQQGVGGLRASVGAVAGLPAARSIKCGV